MIKAGQTKHLVSVSVVIPTLGRKKELIETVAALTRQTVAPLEVLVVDQNVPEIEEVSAFFRTLPLVRHVRSPKPGLVHNYNRCLEEARGEIVLYVDDDVVPRDDLVEKHRQNYLDDEHGKIGCVAGRILSVRGDRDPVLVNRVGSYAKWTGSVVAQFNGLERKRVQFGQGANLSFRRKALNEIGGFDPRFDGNAYFFETDAGLRLIARGYEVVFDPRAELDHLMAPSGGARVSDKAVHTFHFVKNGIRLYRRHSPAVGLPLFIFKQGAYVTAKAAVNLNARIFFKGLRGIFEGLIF